MKKILRILIIIIVLNLLFLLSGCQSSAGYLTVPKVVYKLNIDSLDPFRLLDYFRRFETSDTKVTMSASRIMLTPYEDSTKQMGLTFNLGFLNENVLVQVVDKSGNSVGLFQTTVNTINVIKSGHSESIFVYKTVIKNLLPNHTYSYTIKAGDLNTKAYAFKTINTDEPTAFAFFGDTQGYNLSQYENFKKTYELALETMGNIDISYIAGDIVDIGDSWDQWQFLDSAMFAYTSKSLFVTAIGNHDVKNSREIYLNTFNYPENGIEVLSGSNFFFDLPYARVAVWDTESPMTYDNQKQWLKDIMADAPEKFKIVLMHRSVYPMAYDELHIRNLSNALDDADIDLVLSGHDHIYSRTTMSNKNHSTLGEGVTYIVGGSSSGSKYYQSKNESIRYWKEFVYDTNNPVFTGISIDKNEMIVKAYAVVNGYAVIMDNIKITK